MTKNKNIFLKNTAKELPYKGVGQVPHNYYNWPDPVKHAKKLEKQLERINEKISTVKDSKGTYLSFSSKPGYELAIKNLEDVRKGIRLLSVKNKGEKKERITTASVFIPQGQENHFIKKIKDFIDKKTPKGKPKNNEFVTSIDEISEALVGALWTSKEEEIPITDSYCEIWLRFNASKDPKKIKIS